MIMKRLCKNCKHLETDGMFGIFCGIGGDNTKYDCPKYEKRVRKITTKQYSNLDVWKMGAENTAKLLNELSEENQSLKKQNKRLHDDLHKINEITRGY